MKRAAPSREAPSASQDLEAGAVLKLGEYADQPTLNTSEARIILKKTLDARRARNHNPDETETLAKTRDYLEIFAVFKEIEEAAAKYYCQQFFNYFGHAAQIPHRLFVIAINLARFS